jgi:phosphatidate cytidylyltransferase
MRKRFVVGALLIAAVAGFWYVDSRLLARPLPSRIALWLLGFGALHEVLSLAARRVAVAPGLFWTGAVAGAIVLAPYLYLGAPPPGVLWGAAAAAAGLIRFASQSARRTAPEAFPEAVLLSGAMLYALGLLSYLDRILLVRVDTAFAVACVAKASDVAGYLVGSSVGRKRIIPAISPKKTWEGTIAGVLASGGVAALLSRELAGPPFHSFLIGISIGVASFCGGWISSGIKRWAGTKDSARILPEFGGILDLMDSLLLAAPVAVIGLYGS